MNPREPVERIDWQEVRQRLARAMQATEEALDPSPERAHAILDERARRLAHVPAAVTDRADDLEVLVFSLARERYAIETQYVRGIQPLRELTLLPGAPDFVTGLINLRGVMLALFDLRKFFGLTIRGLDEQSRVIVLGEERDELGVLADAVQEVAVLRADRVREPPESVAGVAREYLRGVTSEALLVLNGAVLLQDSRLIIDQGEEGGK